MAGATPLPWKKRVMEDLKQMTRPLTERLPEEVRNFLEGGGGGLVLGILGLVFLLALSSALRRLVKLLFRRARGAAADWDAPLRIDLAECPLPVAAPGPFRLHIYHLPVRLRLVVVAPVGTEAFVDAITVEKLLDRILPGLRELTERDRPRIRVWPAQMSQQGFGAAFHRRTRQTRTRRRALAWILAAGKARAGTQTVMLGLGLWADEPCTLDRLTLEPHQWLDVLRIRTSDG